MKRLALELMAFLWPVGVLAWVPWTNWPVVAVLAIPVAAMGFRFRHVPLSLLWPAGLGIVLALLQWVRGGDSGPLVPLLVFLATVGTVRGSGALAQCANRATEGALVLAAMNFVFIAGLGFPTAFNPATRVVMAVSPSLGSGILTLALALPLAVGMVRMPGPRHQRIAAVLTAVLVVANLGWYAYQALPNVLAAGAGQALPEDLVGWLQVAILLWIVARVAGNLLTSRIEDEMRLQVPFLLSLAAGSVIMAWAWPAFDAGHGVFLGLAASACPMREETELPWGRRREPIAYIIIFGLTYAFLQGPYVTRDPRYYRLHAVQIMGTGDMEAFDAYLDFVDARAPNERMTHFLRACAAMQRRDPNAAAQHFVQMTRVDTTARRVLDGPFQPEMEAFLRDLRDLCAGLPDAQRGLAYERALVAVGEGANALESLRLRTPETLPPPPDTPPEPLAETLAEALGDPGLAEPLGEWDAGALAYFVALSQD